MSFEIDKPSVTQSPEFIAGLAVYNEQVAELGVKIKAAQSELDEINGLITQAKVDLQAAYSMKIASSEQTIKDLLDKISGLEGIHDQLVIDINGKRIQRDNILLDFTAREKQLSDSWTDFHKQAGELLAQQNELTDAKATLAKAVAQLVQDQTNFSNSKTSQQAQIDQMQAAAQEALDKGNATVIIAQEEMDKANALADNAMQQQKDLAAQVAASQPILEQAAEVKAQAEKNAIDASNNSKQALQNDQDAREIRVAKIAIQNQQLSLQARENAVSLAEQKIGG